MKFEILQGREALCRRFGDIVAQASADAVARHGVFHVAVSGGSMASQLAQPEFLARPDIDWSRWRVYFCDERCVPHGHADSNYRLWRDALLSRVAISSKNVFPINEALLDDPVAAAADYARLVSAAIPERRDGQPVLDLVLLGMGPDGHTCSLFPGHPLLESTAVVDSLVDSPKPPPARITLTFPSIRAAHQAVFVVAGSDKASAVSRVRRGDALPAGLVSCDASPVLWLVEDSAAM